MAKLQVCHAIDLWHFEYLLLLLWLLCMFVVVPSLLVLGLHTNLLLRLDSIRLDSSNMSFFVVVVSVSFYRSKWKTISAGLYSNILLFLFILLLLLLMLIDPALHCCCVCFFSLSLFYCYYFDIKQIFYCIYLSKDHAIYLFPFIKKNCE